MTNKYIKEQTTCPELRGHAIHTQTVSNGALSNEHVTMMASFHLSNTLLYIHVSHQQINTMENVQLLNALSRICSLNIYHNLYGVQE